jgi:hypothetical protein
MKLPAALSILPRFVLCLAVQGLLGGPALAHDLSIVSDFGKVDFSYGIAQIIQDGYANRASSTQSNDLGASAPNYSEIRQEGSNNDVSSTQTGDQNRIRIQQTGESNMASVAQTGFGNTTDITQTGFGNALSATQNGNNNSILFSQPGFATAELVEIGNNNTINATSKVGTTIRIRLEGNNLTATVRQN